MDLRQLNYFIAVAQERHLGRAAERLHLSQPPLTRQIQALEEELGVQLFVRTARGMVLTQAGETLLKDALNIRSLVDVAAARTQRAGLGQVGRLDIGVYGSSIFGEVAELISRFRTVNPDVQLALNHATAVDQATALRQGRVLAVFERWLPDEPGITRELLAQEAILVAMNENHSLAQASKVPVKKLKNETLIVGMAPPLVAQMVTLCKDYGFEPHLAPPANDIIMSALQAATGTGVALVPQSMGNVHFPGITYRPLSSSAVMDVYCYYMQEEQSPLLAALLDTVRAHRAD